MNRVLYGKIKSEGFEKQLKGLREARKMLSREDKFKVSQNKNNKQFSDRPSLCRETKMTKGGGTEMLFVSVQSVLVCTRQLWDIPLEAFPLMLPQFKKQGKTSPSFMLFQDLGSDSEFMKRSLAFASRTLQTLVAYRLSLQILSH